MPHRLPIDWRANERAAARRRTRIAWAIVGVLALGLATAPTVGWIVRTVAQARRDADLQESIALLEMLRKAGSEDLAQVEAVVKLAADSRDTWSAFPDLAAIIHVELERLALVMSVRVPARRAKESLDSIESELDADPTAEQIDTLFRDTRNPELAVMCANSNEALQPRLVSLRQRTERAYVDVLRRAAGAAANATDGAQLVLLGRYEDVLRTLAEEAQMAKDVERSKTYTAAARDAFEQSNRIVEQVFTPDYQARVAWRDLLADASNWEGTPSDTMRFEFTSAGLAMTNEGAEAKIAGVYYKAGRTWRDYVCDCEFTLTTGIVTLYTRTEVMDAKKVPAVVFSLAPEPPAAPHKVDVVVAAGVPVTAQLSVLGGTFAVVVDGRTVRAEPSLPFAMARKGWPALSVRADTKVAVRRLRVRLLR